MRSGGLLNLDNEGMRQGYLDAVAPALLEHGYDVGVTRDGDRWTYGDLPWDRWNRLQRRLESPT
jgi:ring-1,2-phenylacetyl-CoA epoxidase subunit PaaA